MPATQTLVSHGAVSTTAAMVPIFRAGRAAAGFGDPFFSDAVGTDYGDTYAFTNGTGTYATTYMRYGSQTTGQYQNYRQYGTFSNFTLGSPSNSTQTPSSGFQQRRYTLRQGASYRSLSYKPSTGSNYGIYLYQLFDTQINAWKTVSGDIFIKAQNKPTSFNEGLAASTIFMYYEGGIERRDDYGQVYHDGYRWMYPRTPYDGWAGSTPLAGANGLDYSACLSRACSGKSGHQRLSGWPDPFRAEDLVGNVYETDFLANGILPMTLGVWDLDSSSNAKLASPFVLKHKMRPIGTAGSDFAIGPLLEAGTELVVSTSEKYWSIGASLYLRQA